MWKVAIASVVIASGYAGVAQATCPVTYTFSNGTTADATQVNKDFSDLTSCVAPLSTPTFNGPVYFDVSSSEVARIVSTGLLVGTTDPFGGMPYTNELVVRAASTGTSAVPFEAISEKGASDESITTWNKDTSGAPLFVTFYTDTTPTPRGSISFNRSSGLVMYNQTSDERLKDWNVTQRDYRAVIDKLWVGDFKKWSDVKHSGKPVMSFGIRAQQAYPLFPEAITKPSGRRNDLWQADYGKLAPLALWGVKNIYKKLDEQVKQTSASAADIATLKQEVALLTKYHLDETAEIARLKIAAGERQALSHVHTASN